LISLEIGLFLVLFPWSGAWEQNRVVNYSASLRPFLLSYYLRGAITGLGLINLWVAATKTREFLRAGRQPPAAGQ
jgi:hypothetical protein